MYIWKLDGAIFLCALAVFCLFLSCRQKSSTARPSAGVLWEPEGDHQAAGFSRCPCRQSDLYHSSTHPRTDLGERVHLERFYSLHLFSLMLPSSHQPLCVPGCTELIFVVVFTRKSSQSSQLCGGAVCPGVCAGCRSLWFRCPGLVDTNAERWTGGWSCHHRL